MKIKTFFNTIFILILLSFLGFVFWLGIEQVELDENTYGIVYTKTSGWRDTPVSSDTFRWSFEKVIPTVYTMHKFKIEQIDISIDSKAYMPSHELYAKSSSIDPGNFEYRYKLTGNMKLDHNFLVKLTSNGTFTKDNYDEWIKKSITETEETIKAFIQQRVNNEDINETTLTSEIDTHLKKLNPHFIYSNLNINLIKPDKELYFISKTRYLSMLKTEESYIEERLKQKNSELLKLDLLEKYGEIFTKYPIMIEYLKVDTNNKLRRAELEDFIESRNNN